jgi:hypothetical protein
MYSNYLANVGNIDLADQANSPFKVNNHIKMRMSFQSIIDANSSSKLQFTPFFGLDVNYNFRKKVTY